METRGSVAVNQFQLSPQRRFSAAGREFLFLIPSTAVVAIDPITEGILDAFQNGPQDPQEVIDSLAGRFPREDLVDTLVEMNQMGAVISTDAADLIPTFRPVADPPLSTLVLNVTNKCNLSCKYCYEFGQDRIAAPAPARYMDEATAFQSVEFLIQRGGKMPRLTLTFFGGETLMNFKVVRKTVEYANRRSSEIGKPIDFSLTTNATLLSEEVIDFLAENRVGVTISIDGPKELHDQFRTFHNGSGSYEQILPRIQSLLKKHRTRPVAARVTLTSQVLDIVSIFDHLHDEIGFYEIGFAPVTTSPGTLYAIGDSGFDFMLEQFKRLGERFKAKAVAGDYIGFSNMTDTLQEIHTGINKDHACGAGLGLLGVSATGDIALCHRFVDSPQHTMGNIHTGLDEGKRREMIGQTHISRKPECHTCWVRGLCSGGCYHEAFVRYGDIGHANLHYCDWIRSWIGTCLETYAEISERNPSFFNRFDERKGYDAS